MVLQPVPHLHETSLFHNNDGWCLLSSPCRSDAAWETKRLRGCSLNALVPCLPTTPCDIVVFQHHRTGTVQLLAGTLMGSGSY